MKHWDNYILLRLDSGKYKMKLCSGPCGLSKMEAEFYRKVKNKDTLKSECKVCGGARSKRRYDSISPEKRREVARARYKANPKGKIKSTGAWAKRNIEKVNERARARYKANPETRKNSNKSWARLNPDKINAKEAKRRAAKRNQSPAWREDKEIKLIHKKVRALTISTGIKMNADHIVPIIHPYVSGFDCIANYQILTAEENMSKGNHWWPDMPNYATMIYDNNTNTLIDKLC
jgi:hypothetical protein